MFDYSTLLGRVRRLINDNPQSYIDSKDATTKDSYYVLLSNEGYAEIHPSGVIVNGIVLSDTVYSVHKNLIQFDILIPSGSDVLINYDMTTYTDELIINYIGDAIETIIQPIFNIDFEFGLDTGSETITNKDIDSDLQALFAQGAIMQILGLQISQTSGDAIYIKDGDTTIDTAASSQEAARGYTPVLKRWNDLVAIVRANRFSGIVQY